MREIKVYYLHTMELSEAASGTAGLVLESDHLQKVKLLEQMRSLDQNAIEAKDHKIVLLEKANAKLEGEINCLNQKYDFQLLVKSNEELKRQLELREKANAKLEGESKRLRENCCDYQGEQLQAFKNANEELKQENTELKAELMAVIKDNINLEHGLKFEASIRESIQERLKNQIDNFRELEAKVKLLEAEILRQALLLKVFGEGRVSINELGDCTVRFGDRIAHLWKGHTMTFENLDLAVVVEHLTPKPSEG